MEVNSRVPQRASRQKKEVSNWEILQNKLISYFAFATTQRRCRQRGQKKTTPGDYGSESQQVLPMPAPHTQSTTRWRSHKPTGRIVSKNNLQVLLGRAQDLCSATARSPSASASSMRASSSSRGSPFSSFLGCFFLKIPGSRQVNVHTHRCS